MTTTATLQAGQDFDPGYLFPQLAVGDVVGSGRTVIAAVRQKDSAGYLPGLHIVTAYDPSPDAVHAYVTWQVAWQQGHGWSAGSGNYFTGKAEALADMIKRA